MTLARNIVVIADEAHRSQYDFMDGFAHHMRDALLNAPFIGFTGTPSELTDKNARLVKTVRANGTIDWTTHENVRARLRVLAKRILRKYRYPPDKQEFATQHAIEQTELLAAETLV